MYQNHSSLLALGMSYGGFRLGWSCAGRRYLSTSRSEVCADRFSIHGCMGRSSDFSSGHTLFDLAFGLEMLGMDLYWTE